VETEKEPFDRLSQRMCVCEISSVKQPWKDLSVCVCVRNMKEYKHKRYIDKKNKSGLHSGVYFPKRIKVNCKEI